MDSQAESDVPLASDERPKTSLPTEAEKFALGQSGPLLRFASENIENLDADLSFAISQSVEAQGKMDWSPATSQRFWGAFNKLCELIRPVTMDCLTALHKNLARRRILVPWRPPVYESLGERTSRRYTSALVAILILVVPLQLLIWVYTNLSTDLDRVSIAINTVATELASKCETLGRTTADAGSVKHVWTADEMSTIDQIYHAESDIQDQSLRLSESTRFLDQFLARGIAADTTANSSVMRADYGDWYMTCIGAINSAKPSIRIATTTSARARLVSAIFLQFVLPILLGAIGALAYVLRNTSDQIKNSTFSTTSPIRNLVRVMLGALMGVVIGLFNGLSNQVSLPPLAIAFLAGYGVEGVFSVFDGFIARLRQPAVMEK